MDVQNGTGGDVHIRAVEPLTASGIAGTLLPGEGRRLFALALIPVSGTAFVLPPRVSDQHAMQATTYAYQNGIRWVVLTNGQEWRLYDSHVTGSDVGSRLCAEVGVDPTVTEIELV